LRTGGGNGSGGGFGSSLLMASRIGRSAGKAASTPRRTACGLTALVGAKLAGASRSGSCRPKPPLDFW